MRLLSVGTSGGAFQTSQYHESINHNSSQSLAVPIVALVTKGDGLVTKKYDELRSRNVPVREARKQAVVLAEEEFKLVIMPRLMSTKYPPAQCVFISSESLPWQRYRHVLNACLPTLDMHKPESNCNEVVAKMAAAITDRALRILFVSTQINNVELCTYYATKEYVFILFSPRYLMY